MAAPVELVRLAEQFELHAEQYRAGHYNETQLRRDFLDPFFKILGWDMDNEKGYAEAYREVIHEDAIKIGGHTKAPDYAFRAGGSKTSFFVEAKKPSVDIQEEIAPAFQLRRYGYSAELPLSLLTDFAELAVYDCRVKPRKTDKPHVARVACFKHSEYVERWDELVDLLSPEAVRRGSLERFVASKKRLKGTARVGVDFLAEIEGWRDELARGFALRNPDLAPRDLNFAVQRTIDRIVFLRICEDRAIEPYGMLQSLLNGPCVYPRLGELFRRADDRYNSGLFHFSPDKERTDPPDELTLGLELDDKLLRDILRNLYYPESPYEFSVFPAEILGQVYEQFLGKVIRLTKGHQAKVEEKPEVRKAGGVYYTPSYIVEYIVEHTIGALLEEKSPRRAAELRILDPACGSGSFLIGAYQFLLDWHRDWYVADDPEKHARGRDPKLFRSTAGDWRLTASERKRILLNNIYGVDIDAQAVEVTKLSLLLKVLEGESRETIDAQLRFFHRRALPDLENNIRCGNSLIGPDYYQDRQLSLLEDEERYRINAFDWSDRRLGFGAIMAGGGFDVVLGNPPYGATADEDQLQHYRQHYVVTGGTCDRFALFIEQASHLLKPAGMFGMIVQSSFVSSPSMEKLRELFVERFQPSAFASMPYDVFAAYVDTVIAVGQRLPQGTTLRDLPRAPVRLTVFPHRFKIESVKDFAQFEKKADAKKWIAADRNEFLVTLSNVEQSLIKKLHGVGTMFKHVADIQRGVTPFRLSAKPTSKKHVPAFNGTVRRYKIDFGEPAFLRYDANLAEYKPERYFHGKRLLLRELISRQFRLQAVYVEEDFVTNKSMQSILLADQNHSLMYLLGILNSKLLSWYFLAVHSVGRRDDFPKIVLKQTRELPFRKIDFADKSDRKRHEKMVDRVEAMLALHRQREAAKTPVEKTNVERQIAAVDGQIDRLVYELYGLTDEEIALVEQTA